MTVTLDDIRDHVGPGPSDDDLQRLLDAALEAIDNKYGPYTGTYTETLQPFGRMVKLGLRATEITTVIEGDETLDAADYELSPDGGGGLWVRRLRDDEPTDWQGMVNITYVPQSEAAERDRITVELVDAGLNGGTDGLTSITVGPWSESYGDSVDSAQARQSSLDSLRPRRVGVW